MSEPGNKESIRKKRSIDDKSRPIDDPINRGKQANADKFIGNKGQVTAEARLAAIKYADEMPQSESKKTDEASASLSSGSTSDPTDTRNWVQLGPTPVPNAPNTYSNPPARVNVTGRIISMVTHPTDSNTIYIGAAQGGIWKTVDLGKNWVPTSDNAPSLAIGALAIDKSNPNVLYAGTGEANFSGDSLYGQGLIKTTDGGKTWNPLGDKKDSILGAPDGMTGFLNARFTRLAINPNKPTTLFASVISDPKSPKVASGIYRSVDGAEKWVKLDKDLPSSSSTQGATDIVLNSTNPNTAYAAFFGEGVYKTINANDNAPSWKKLDLPDLSPHTFSRIVLGISLSSPNVLYALVANDDDTVTKFYQSTNNGDSWNSITLPDYLAPYYSGIGGNQGSYNLNVAVHPKNENVVYLSALSLFKAVGHEITIVGERIHPDNHAFAFDPNNPEIIYAGNDGGIYKSNDGGNTWDDSINEGLCITQFEFMDQDPSSENMILAGTQDNGTIQYNGKPKFYFCNGGDGGYACIDQTDPNNMWHTRPYLNPFFSPEKGLEGTWHHKQHGLQIPDPNTPWMYSVFYPPLALDRTNSNNIAIGGELLYLDDQKGSHGWPVKIDLGLAPQVSSTGQKYPHLINAISYVNSNLIYVGTELGGVCRLVKNSNGWKVKAIHASPLPYPQTINDIATMPNKDDEVVVIFSGFSRDPDSFGHVYHCKIGSDGSTKWTDISGSSQDHTRLPNAPHQALVIDERNPNIMYVSSDVGVFRTIDAGKNWGKIGKGLPEVQVYDMRLFYPKNLLRAATHGRGMWQLKLDSI
jgi:hypothetical protein